MKISSLDQQTAGQLKILISNYQVEVDDGLRGHPRDRGTPDVVDSEARARLFPSEVYEDRFRTTLGQLGLYFSTSSITRETSLRHQTLTAERRRSRTGLQERFLNLLERSSFEGWGRVRQASHIPGV